MWTGTTPDPLLQGIFCYNRAFSVITALFCHYSSFSVAVEHFLLLQSIFCYCRAFWRSGSLQSIFCSVMQTNRLFGCRGGQGRRLTGHSALPESIFCSVMPNGSVHWCPQWMRKTQTALLILEVLWFCERPLLADAYGGNLSAE